MTGKNKHTLSSFILRVYHDSSCDPPLLNTAVKPVLSRQIAEECFNVTSHILSKTDTFIYRTPAKVPWVFLLIF